MRVFHFIVFALFWYAPIEVFAQEEYPGIFPDTIPMEVHSFFYTTRPDTFTGDTVYRLAKPECYVLLQVHMEYISFLVFKKEKKHWKVFNPAPYPEMDGGSYSFDTINFDGKGSPELLVRWQELRNESGDLAMNDHITEGFYLWDMDHVKLIYHMRDRYTFEGRWNNRYIDSAGEVSANEIIVTICRSYIVKIEQGKITIQSDSDCAEVDEETGMILPEHERVYEYEAIDTLLILKR